MAIQRQSGAAAVQRRKSETRPDSEHAAATRIEILAAAADAFARNGYVATTLNDIADTLGFTKPSLYYYFPSKYAILSELFDQMIFEYFSDAQRVAQSDMPPDRKLRALFDKQIDFVVTRTNWTIVFTNEVMHLDEEKQKSLRQRRRKYDQLLQNIYEEGVKSGIFRNADSYAVVAGMIGLATSLSVWYRPGGRMTPAELKDLYWGLISRGCFSGSARKA